MSMRIGECLLVLLVFVTAGCGFFGDSETTNENANANTSANANTTANANANARVANSSVTAAPPIDWQQAISRVEAALAKLSSATPVTGTQIEGDVTGALKIVEKDDNAFRQKCSKCDPAVLSAAADARRPLNDLATLLQNTIKNQPIRQSKAEVISKLEDAKLSLESAKAASQESASTGSTESSTPSAGAGRVDSGANSTEGFLSWPTLLFAMQVLGGALILMAIVAGLVYLRNQSWNKLEAQLAGLAQAQASAAKNGHAELKDKLVALASTQNDLSSRLYELHTEVRSLSRVVRDSVANRERNPPPPYPSYSSSLEPAYKEEPEFPISAVDYLGKMNRFANVVRPDFQNGILVNDPDGKGELVLIRDARVADDTQPLFVVPRTTQFQTKQDFYTYYEKYYDCAKPSAGDVWIIDPAVVSRVAGGWQLREKGVLEIR